MQAATTQNFVRPQQQQQQQQSVPHQHNQQKQQQGESSSNLQVQTIQQQPQPSSMHQQQSPHQHMEGNQELSRMCFVCCLSVTEQNYESVKTSMNHSHAPLLVLLTDVLGYKLDDSRLHSEVVCKSCYHLLDIIDELQQTLAESKTDVRTKFLETVSKMRLKYPRTDKMLKPRCLRCIQMSQTQTRRRGRGGRGFRGRGADEGNSPKGRGNRGRGRGKGGGGANPQEIQQINTDNDSVNVMLLEVEPDIDVDDDSSQQHQQQQQQQQQQLQQTTQQPVKMPQPAPNIVFDTDPAFFSPDEKLKVGIIREEESVGVPVQQAFLCMYCPSKCESAIALKMHVRVYHMPVLVYDNGLGTAETRYRMGIKLQNTSSTEFSTTEKPFACLFCESSYKLQSSLQSHFREQHSPHKPFECLECKEGFRRPIELSRHRLYRCPVLRMHSNNQKKEKNK